MKQRNVGWTFGIRCLIKDWRIEELSAIETKILLRLINKWCCCGNWCHLKVDILFDLASCSESCEMTLSFNFNCSRSWYSCSIFHILLRLINYQNLIVDCWLLICMLWTNRVMQIWPQHGVLLMRFNELISMQVYEFFDVLNFTLLIVARVLSFSIFNIWFLLVL